jgi:hypothetical protein
MCESTSDPQQGSSCKCAVCQAHRTFQEHLAQVPEHLKPYFEALYDIHVHTALDRDYYAAIVDGSWPDADELIKRIRDRKAAVKTRESNVVPIKGEARST